MIDKKMRAGSVINSLYRCLVWLILMTLTACRPNGSSGTTQLATPEGTCIAPPASWQGIVPGQSTKAEVISLLGEPSEKGRSSSFDQDFFLYPPIVTILDSYGNLVVFRRDGVVDWIDMWVSNADGKFHTVAGAVQRYGSTLDTVYVNGSIDVFGPDHVYVWSECGIAISAVHESWMKRSDDEVLPLAEPVGTDNVQLSYRYPVSPHDITQPRPDVNQIIFRQFLFQPTTFGDFNRLYRTWIRHVNDNRLFRLK